MTPEDNLKIVRGFLNGEVDLMAEGATFDDYTSPEPLRGNQVISQMIYDFYHVSFPGAEADIQNTVSGDKSVTLEFIFRGVHTGEWRGIPPTGKSVAIPMCVVYDLENSIIQRGRLYFDYASMRRQLGLDGES